MRLVPHRVTIHETVTLACPRVVEGQLVPAPADGLGFPSLGPVRPAGKPTHKREQSSDARAHQKAYRIHSVLLLCHWSVNPVFRHRL
jgi:hypothetical protein